MWQTNKDLHTVGFKLNVIKVHETEWLQGCQKNSWLPSNQNKNTRVKKASDRITKARHNEHSFQTHTEKRHDLKVEVQWLQEKTICGYKNDHL
jgi:hypothetical protein